MMERELFVCECEDVNHQFIITYFDDDVFNNEICIEIHLSDVGLWNRIKYAFQYLLGKRSRYSSGAFGEVLLNKEDTAKLIGTLQNYYEVMN